MEKFDWIFIGSKLTNIIAIKEIISSNKNSKIALLSSSSIGGHFSEIEINNKIYDPGTVFHEFTSFNNSDQNNIKDYNPKIRNDLGKYYFYCEKYIRKNIDLEKSIKPKMLYKGNLYDDIIMSNSFETFYKLPFKNKIHKDLSLIIKNNNQKFHPKDKGYKEVYKSVSYKEASLNNHGNTLHHEIFEPFFQKMTNRSTDKLLALYSRVAWLPLYYPETIFDILNDKKIKIKSTEFHYPKEGFIGALAKNIYSKSIDMGLNHLTERINFKETARTLNEGIISFVNGSLIKGEKIIFSDKFEKLINKSFLDDDSRMELEGWSVNLLFITVDKIAIKKKFSCIYFPEEDSLLYRLRYQPNLKNENQEEAKLIIELNPEYTFSRGYKEVKDILVDVLRTLVEADLIKVGFSLRLEKELKLYNGVSLPSSENINKLRMQMDLAAKYFPKIAFPSLNGFFQDTLNDQVLKGLTIGINNKST